MKKLILVAGLSTVCLLATDFSQMTIEELSAMRGTVPVAERDAFRAEMQKQLKAMTPEERQAYTTQRRESAGKGSGQGSMQRLRDGSGGGMMRGGGRKR